MWTLRRSAARVVVLDPNDRVLLIHSGDPADPSKGTWWELPGGGMEAGETSAAAAGRELFEETGIRRVDIGPCVWRQHARYTFAGYDFDSHEHVHLARVVADPGGADGHVEYQPAGLEALEALAFKGMRWWELGLLADMIADGGRVIPPWLVEQVSSVLAHGLPDEPIHLGDLDSVF